MSIDVSKINYGVSLMSPTGGVSNLTASQIALSWEERIGELSQRCTIKMQGNNGAKLNCPVTVSANGISVLQGVVWEWEYSHSQKQEITLTVYDPLIRLQKSKDSKYYSAGMDTAAIIGDICADWGISLSYSWDSITHQKKSFKAQTISNMIVGLLDEVKDKTGSKYVILFKNGMLNISHQGTNNSIYVFSGDNTVSVKNSLTMDNLVTRVKIVGKEENQGRTPVESIVDGRLEFGVLQEIVMRDSNKSIGEANEEAQTLIKEKGTPEETIRISAPDVPFIRKGDRVKVMAGNLSGYFFVDGISHDATSRTMNMELKRS